MDEQIGESKEVIDAGIGESEIEKLVAEWGWRTDKESWFQRQSQSVTKGAIRYFLARMMLVCKSFPVITVKDWRNRYRIDTVITKINLVPYRCRQSSWPERCSTVCSHQTAPARCLRHRRSRDQEWPRDHHVNGQRWRIVR